jgi:hypothetical protein
LGVIAGRGRYDAFWADAGAGGQQLENGPTDLEGTGLLQIFKLQVNIPSEHPAEGGGMDQRGLQDAVAECRGRFFDAVQGDHDFFIEKNVWGYKKNR